MGNCGNSKPEIVPSGILYSEIALLKIKERDYTGHVISLDKIKFKITSPVLNTTQRFLHMPFAFDITSVVIPGLDPRELVDKECQDNLFFIEKENTTLAALFDGHGQDGFKVTKFCKTFMLAYFNDHFEAFKTSPKQAIAKIIEDCDEALKSKSNLNYLISGTTAVVMFINGSDMHVASVGDSRAVLGTLPKSTEEVFQVEKPIKPNPYKRFVEPARVLSPLALTVDQKPNHQEELERILKSGGKVQQLTDERGNKIGPFRV